MNIYPSSYLHTEGNRLINVGTCEISSKSSEHLKLLIWLKLLEPEAEKLVLWEQPG